jgi:MFS family permease
MADLTLVCPPAGVAPSVRLASAQGRWLLVATILGSGLASVDATVVNIALPAIGRDLGMDFAGLQWTLTAYTLTLASFILLGGSAGDRFGRRRVFLVGVVWFAAARPTGPHIVAASSGAALLVLPRPQRPRRPFRPRLDPWTLAVIQAAACPVLLVPDAARERR